MYISTAIHLPFGNSCILLMIWTSSQQNMYNQRAPRSNQFPWKAVHQGWRIRDQLKIIISNKLPLCDSEHWAYMTRMLEQKKIGSANFCLPTSYWTAIEHTWLVCSSKSKSAMISMMNFPCGKHVNHVSLRITRISGDWYTRLHSPTFALAPRMLDHKLENCLFLIPV